MDAKMQTFLEKVKVMADKTSKAAGRAADAAGKKATELASATRINLQIFDLNTECEVLFKEIGRMVYELHRGTEVSNEEMDQKIDLVDEKQARIAALREELAGDVYKRQGYRSASARSWRRCISIIRFRRASSIFIPFTAKCTPSIRRSTRSMISARCA